MKKLFLFITIISTLFMFSACSEADKENHNISKQADYFEC